MTAIGALSLLTVCAAGADVRLWAVDPHEKVFADAAAPEGAGVVRMRCARNEYASGQAALRLPYAEPELRIQLTAPAHAQGKTTLDEGCLTWNPIGTIRIEHNTRGSERIRVREAPCDVPDPLLERRTTGLPENATACFWFTAHVPEDAPAGLYRSRFTVVTAREVLDLPVELTVDPFTLPDERHLFVTNWFSASRIASYHKVEPWSEDFWRLMARYARHLAEHRQNVVLAPWNMVGVTREPDGSLTFDYARFDRFVGTFDEAGAAERIELGFVGRFGKDGWGGKEIVPRDVQATDRKTGKTVGLEPRQALRALLRDLEAHLEARGWLARAMIHVADEPSISNIDSWRELSAFVHEAAPRIRRIDAIETIDFTGALEVWVPKLSHFDRWREAYEACRPHAELWFYICCHPYGSVYPNRFLDYPLAKVRVLHWINWACDLEGYLHWGLESWRGGDAFAPPTQDLPPGDTHVIYPGTDGPLSSMRWEIQRESLEDFELLHLLTDRTRAMKQRLGGAADGLDERRRSDELCGRVVRSLRDTEADPANIVAVRDAVADEIIALEERPWLLAQTEPKEGSELVEGPIAVEVRGAVEPGATVTVNGRRAEVAANGRFALIARPSAQTGQIVIEAALDGRTKATARRFTILK